MQSSISDSNRQITGLVHLPSNTLQISHREIDRCHAGVQTAASSDPNGTVNIEGGAQEVGFSGLSLSFEQC